MCRRPRLLLKLIAITLTPLACLWSVPSRAQTGARASAGCDGINATIVGTSGPDRIRGTNHRDVISTGAGDDIIDGMSGADVILRGDDDDVVYGRLGQDVLLGKAGRDTLRGGAGDDLLYDGRGRDRVFGGAGKDAFQALVCNGSPCAEGRRHRRIAYVAGPGMTNTCAAWSVPDCHGHVEMLLGVARQGKSRDFIASIENATGGLGDDVLAGDFGPNVLDAVSGNDVIRSRRGNDFNLDSSGGHFLGAAENVVVFGGRGIDWIDFLADTKVDLRTGRGTSGEGRRRIKGVENIREADRPTIY